MEWQFAFDIHCNSFFVLFLFLYVLQVRVVLLCNSATPDLGIANDDCPELVSARSSAGVRFVPGARACKSAVRTRLGFLHVLDVPWIHGYVVNCLLV